MTYVQCFILCLREEGPRAVTALYFGWPAFRNRHFVNWGRLAGGGTPPIIFIPGGVSATVWGFRRKLSTFPMPALASRSSSQDCGQAFASFRVHPTPGERGMPAFFGKWGPPSAEPPPPPIGGRPLLGCWASGESQFPGAEGARNFFFCVLGSRAFNWGGGGSVEPPKTGAGGGSGDRAQLTGSFFSFYGLWRRKFF